MTDVTRRPSPADPQTRAGDVIIAANLIGTVAFTVTAVTAAVVFSTASQWVGAITAMALFAIGVFAFLWSFWNVVQRSRDEQIAVTQVYLLLGAPTPKRVRVRMLGLLAVQVIVAFATAFGRSKDLDGSPGTSLAVGVLVPMFGMGLNGLWSAYHGVYPPLAPPDTDLGATSAGPIDKNKEHG
jgi:Zn-dependent protease with chaperone function